MTRVECILRPDTIADVKEALVRLGVNGMTVTEVIGCGFQKGYTALRGSTKEMARLLPKIKIELIVPDSILDEAVSAIVACARTGQIGDGKIFLSPVTGAVRIRTGEAGECAIMKNDQNDGSAHTPAGKE